MIISLVIPVYNVEQYLEKCILSCIHQDIPLSEYEIVIINDGSRDNSIKIIEKYALSTKNIKVVHKNNGGLSSARNRGIKEASGDFLWFIDSDDWIEENCLGNVIESLDKDTDMLAFNSYIPEGGRSTNSVFWGEKVSNKESLFLHGFTDPAQFYIFRRMFLIKHDLIFKEGIKHEDVWFTPIALSEASKIKFYRKPLYHFLKREGSITTVSDVKRLIDLSDTMSYLYKYSLGIDNTLLRKAFQNHMAHHIIEMLVYGVENGKTGEQKTKIIMSEHPEYWQLLRNAFDLKPRLIYWILKISPLPYLFTYRLLNKLR